MSDTKRKPEITAARSHASGGVVFTVHQPEMLGPNGVFCARLVEKWGMVAGETDGEDSAGRQKFRLQTPQEVVDRAVAVTKIFAERMTLEGWSLPLPTQEEGRRMLQESTQRMIDDHRV